MKMLTEGKNVLWVALLALFGIGTVSAQVEPVGGPYEPDSATVLLMHFDGDLTNVADFSADGTGYGNYSFFPISAYPELGESIRFDNDATIDSAYVTVPDTSYLDLTGNWTIEGWINIFTFGETSSDHRWVPRLVIKTGDSDFFRPNYFVEMWGDRRFFSCGYHAATLDAWPQVNSPNNTLVPGAWFHIAFIRDTTRQVLIQLTHNADRELVVFNVEDYRNPAVGGVPDDPTPITTDQPLHIGFAGGGNDSWLDGFVDEVRISNTIRNFAVPPVITDLDELENQPVSVSSYSISGNITPFSQGATIAAATIHYNDGSGWMEVAMSPTGGDIYSGTIPQKPLGTIINYYISAEDNFGSRSTSPSTAESSEPTYLAFGVYEPNTQTLQLTFEGGQGTPIDYSQYTHTVEVFGAPTYSTDSKEGSNSLFFEGDSSYLEIDSPFLASREFTVDFWFKADTIIQFTRLINKPIDPDNYFQNNYSIRFEPQQKIRARFWSDAADTYNEILLPSFPNSLSSGVWYHVIYEVSATEAVFELRDENDALIESKVKSVVDPPVLAAAPLRIGYAAGRPKFQGRLDKIEINNYAAGITAIEDEGAIPLQFTLRQNYPNPFNPSTIIQFAIPNRQTVRLIVYDLLGRKIRTLVDDEVEAGRHTVTWDGKNELGQSVSSGLYLYRLHSDNFIQVRKMLLLR